MGLLDNQTAQSYYDSSSLQSYGGYQFISLDEIINQFIIAYVGENKLISKVSKVDISFHAQRALQELSFDTLKSVKSIEVEVPPSLSVVLPQDYVNYVKLAWSDSAGIEHIIYPVSKTSNPFPIKQNSDGTYDFDANDDGFLDSPILKHQNTIQKSVDPAFALAVASTAAIPLTQYATYAQTIDVGGSISTVVDNTSDLEVGMFVFHKFFPYGTKISAITAGVPLGTNGGTITLDTASTNQNVTTAIGDLIFSKNLAETSDTLSKYKSHNSSTTTDDYEDDTRWYAEGRRYGLDPQHAQDNGSYFIDNTQGRVYLGSFLSGKTLVLKYISDSLGTDEEMRVHKFAEQAMYISIAHAILSTRANVQEYVVRRFQKDKFAAVRKAKLRLSNLKLEELTQILRGKSKHIKH